MQAVFRLLLIGLFFQLTVETHGAVNLSSGSPVIGSGEYIAPTITSVRGRRVLVQVPSGYEQITIERLVRSLPQKWTAYAFGRTTADGGEVAFTLRKAIPKRHLRVVGRKAKPLPPKPPVSTSGRPSVFTPPPGIEGGMIFGGNINDGFVTLLGDGSTGLTLASNGTANATTTAAREVVESDIWKLHGDRLYVFNHYRGLQVLDLANPAVPVLLGTLPLPDAGDALYLLNDTHVALVAKRDVNFTWNAEPPRSTGSLVICDVSAGQPKAVATIPLQGRMIESRLVGTALYVATSQRSGASWKDSLSITGFDLSDPANPVERNTVTIALSQIGYSIPGPVQASDRYFLVTENRRSIGVEYRSRVFLVDISSPNGTVALRGNVNAAGTVNDKFKMQERNGVLTLISDVPRNRNTQLENFDLTNASAPTLLGTLTLGQNESVRGTRFDGDRVYVVTFLQIDPLWIVDNSSPRTPVVAGHLEVPGFSTYLEPMGDRLVTIGLVNNRVSVSLFDVADPTKPAVLSQLPVTAPYAWSEATWNEKAFSVNPEAGLIMLPVTTNWSMWDQSPVTQGGIQLVDLERQQLKLRGRINRNFVPRRSEFHRGTIVALSDADLLTADTTDRDHPTVLAEVQLAWKTLHAWPLGNHLVQVGAEISGRNPVISVSPTNDPDATVTSVSLPNRPVIAADLRDGLLYVVQGTQQSGLTFPASGISLTTFDVSSLPQVVQKGTVAMPGTVEQNGKSQLVWPQPGTLVLATMNYGSFGGPILIGDIPLIGVHSITEFATGSLTLANAASSTLAANSLIYWPYPRLNLQRLLAFDVTDPKQPAYLTETILDPKRGGSFSEVIATAGKVFASFQNDWGYHTLSTQFTISLDPGIPFEIQDDRGRSFLHVVDYANPAVPKIRTPVSSPGTLKGVSRSGTVVFTDGWEYDITGVGIGASKLSVHASIYDGTKLELASQLSLAGGARSLVHGETVFTFYYKATAETGGKLASYASLWEVQPELQFVERDSILFGGYNERAFDGVLFSTISLTNGSAISAVDFSNPGDLQKIGTISTSYVGYELSKATGDRTNGFWIPLGDYGVLKLELPAP